MLNEELLKEMVGFIFEMKESTKHAATLGCGPELNARAIHFDAQNLLRKIQQEAPQLLSP